MDNFGEMVTHVSNRTGEDDTTLIKEFLNQAYQELAGVAQIPIASAVEQVSVTAGVLASFPSGMFEIEQVKLLAYNGETVDKGENILTPISINEIDDDTGQPTSYYKDGEKFGLYPGNKETAVVEFRGHKYVDDMTLDADVPVAQIRKRYYPAFANFAIAKIKEDDEEFNEADRFMGYFAVDQEKLRIERSKEKARPHTVIPRVYR